MFASPSRFVGSLLVDGGIGLAARSRHDRNSHKRIGIGGQEAYGTVEHHKLLAAKMMTTETAGAMRRAEGG